MRSSTLIDESHDLIGELQCRRLGSMTNEYTIRAVQEEQERLKRVAEHQNIQRLQAAVNTAKAELEEALLKRQNRMMSQEMRT